MATMHDDNQPITSECGQPLKDDLGLKQFCRHAKLHRNFEIAPNGDLCFHEKNIKGKERDCRVPLKHLEWQPVRQKKNSWLSLIVALLMTTASALTFYKHPDILLGALSGAMALCFFVAFYLARKDSWFFVTCNGQVPILEVSRRMGCRKKADQFVQELSDAIKNAQCDVCDLDEWQLIKDLNRDGFVEKKQFKRAKRYLTNA